MAQSGSVQAFSWVKSGKPSSGPWVEKFPEDTGMTFKKGDPVKLAAADGRLEDALEAENFMGIADQDASGVVDTEIRVTMLTPSDILRVSVSTAGAELASAQSQAGEAYGFLKSVVSGETDKTVLDIADVANACFELVTFRDPIGRANGEVHVRAVAAKLLMR